VHGTAQDSIEACISHPQGEVPVRDGGGLRRQPPPPPLNRGRAACGNGPYSVFEAGHGVCPFEATLFRGGYTPQVPPSRVRPLHSRVALGTLFPARPLALGRRADDTRLPGAQARMSITSDLVDFTPILSDTSNAIR
jgi:hypothetical protein